MPQSRSLRGRFGPAPLSKDGTPGPGGPISLLDRQERVSIIVTNIRVRQFRNDGKRFECLLGPYPLRVYAVAFSPDDALLAAGGGDFTSGSVQLFDVAQREKLHTLEGYKAFVHAVAFSPDGSLLATGGGDWSVRVWSASDGKSPIATPPANPNLE